MSEKSELVQRMVLAFEVLRSEETISKLKSDIRLESAKRDALLKRKEELEAKALLPDNP